MEEAWKNQLDKMARAIPEGIAVVSQDGLIMYANAASKDMLGLKEDDIIGRTYDDPIWELTTVDNEPLPRDEHPVTRALRSGYPAIGVKLSLKRPDGTRIFLSVSATPHGDSYGSSVGVIMTFKDITKEQRDEQALRESEAKYRTLVEHVPAITYIAALDYIGTAIYISPQIERLLGFSQDEYISDPNFWRNHIYSEDHERVMKGIAESIETGRPFISEYRMVTRDGSTKWFRDEAVIVADNKGNPLFFQGVMFDVSERKQIESALKESEERHKALFEKAPDAIFVLKAEGKNVGEIVLANQAAARMHGYTVAELQTLNMVKDIDIPETAKKAPGRIKRVLEGEWIKFEARHRKKDGSIFPVEVHAGPFEVENQKYILAFDRNITERKRMEELNDALNDINVTISATLDFDEILERATVESCGALGAESAIVALHSDHMWVVKHLYNLPQEYVGLKFSERELANATQAAKTRKPVFINDAYNDKRANRELMKKHKIRSFLIVPLAVRGEIIGGLFFIHRSAPIPFTEAEIDFASKLSTSISLALSNARLYAERAREKELSDSLNRINAAINSTLDFSKIMKRVVVKASRAMGCEAAKVDLREGDFWVVRNLYGLPKELLGESFSDKEAKYAALAARTRKPIISNDAYNDRRVSPELMKKYNIRSLLVIPLIVRAEVIGVLVFMHRSSPVAFIESQIDFANKLATSISLALENARLYSTERNISDTLQETLLTLPQEVPCIDFGYLYRSATETARVGGDFYDVFELDHSRVGLLIGDVSGKGLEAATLTSLVKNTIKAYAYEDTSPATVVRKTNEVVLKSSAPTMFVTLFLGMLDPVTGRLIYCSAGHPPAFIRRSNNDISFLTTGSPAAGAFPNLDFIDDITTMDENDLLLLYTDGVIEARCSDGFFGEEKLLNVVKGLERIETKDVPRIVFDSILECTGGMLSDDLAIVAVSLAKL